MKKKLSPDFKAMCQENADFETDGPRSSPWICHVCGHKSHTGEGVACSVCYKITCALHLQHKSSFNPASGLYELQPICLLCAGAKLH